MRFLYGVLYIVFAIFVTIALCSYNPNDPSFNHVTTAAVQNWAGVYGAYISDPLFNMLGYASFLIATFTMAQGLYVLRYLTKHLHMIKWTCLLILLPNASMLIGLFANDIVERQRIAGFIGAVLVAELNLISTYWPLVSFSISLPILLFVHNAQSFAYTLLQNSVNYAHHTLTKYRDKLTVNQLLTNNVNVVRVSPKIKESNITERKSHNKTQGKLTLSADAYQVPPLDLLKAIEHKRKQQVNESALAQNARILQQVLEDFGVRGEIIKINPGPVVTLYEFEPAAGVKSSRVIGLADDIARSMSAISARISVVPGKSALGIELPNTQREIVLLKELLQDEVYQQSADKLPLVLGKNIGGEAIVADLAKMPHLLVAGTTGSGKSVAINTMILSLLFKYNPQECKFIMIDPKMLELSVYDGIPHLLAPVVTEAPKAIAALKWVVKEMESRYRMMSTAGVRNIEGFNKEMMEAQRVGKEFSRQVQIGFDPVTGKPLYENVVLANDVLPFIVVIVDEMADLMLVAGKDIETSIQRLAQMARAAGIHIIMATQRPSVDVITGVIKANFPTRVSFQVTSKIDSRTILGEQGAEQLLGQGDMLFMRGGGRIERVHGPFVSDKEVEQIVAFIKMQGAPNYIETVTQIDDDSSSGMSISEEGDLYQQAVAIVIRDKKASTSYIQRCLRIGYNRAASIIEQMEREGVVSPANHVGKREVLREYGN